MQGSTPGEYEKIRKEGQYTVGAERTPIRFEAIGRRGIRRLDGYEKASGGAIFTRDLQIPGMLFAKALMSPYPRARILRMETSRAMAYPGVRSVIKFDDPETRDKMLNGSFLGPERVCPEMAGWALKPVRPVLGDEAWYEGQPLGVAIAGDTEDVVTEALRLVEIDWEVLPFVLDQEDALKPDAPILRPGATGNLLEDPRALTMKGDVEKGLREADAIIEFSARRNAHLWAGAELPSALVRWNGDHLEMWVHEQQPYHAKMLLSEALDIPMNSISMHTPYQGCSFGGRGNSANHSENGMNILAALLARKTGKPVKFLYSRGETFFGESGDMMVAQFKVGTRKDGTITAVQMKNIFAVYMCTSGADHLIDNTRISNIRCGTLTADVSKGPAWWNRCEHLPSALCLTLICDHVAAELGLDPTEVALRNDGCDGHDTTFLSTYKARHGFPETDSLKLCIEAGKKAIGWNEKWHPPGQRRLPNGRMHGLGFTWNHQWDDVRGTGSAAVMIENDGTVSILAQHADIGVNPWTTYCQIVADELGVHCENVRVKPFTMDTGFALMSPDGSCNLASNGNIVRKAARKAKGMLLELASTKFPAVSLEDLEVAGGFVRLKANPDNRKTIKELVSKAMPTFFSGGYWSEAPIIAWAWHTQGIWGKSLETNRPRLCRQTHFIEIEVDTDTGEVEVKKLVNVNDVGKAISPETVEGQMYGGSTMGLSRALTEEMIWDRETGVLLNRNLLDYKYATMLDHGLIETIIKESGMGHGPYGSVGIGEDTATVIPALLGPAVHNAIGKWVDDFPITPDKTLRALGKA